jgi:hypothetical protein
MRAAERPLSKSCRLAQARLSSIAAAVLMGVEAGRQAGGASINVETERHRVTLKYRSCPYGEGWTEVEQRFPVVWTPCRFGGDRPWFICSVYANGNDFPKKPTRPVGDFRQSEQLWKVSPSRRRIIRGFFCNRETGSGPYGRATANKMWMSRKFFPLPGIFPKN